MGVSTWCGTRRLEVTVDDEGLERRQVVGLGTGSLLGQMPYSGDQNGWKMEKSLERNQSMSDLVVILDMRLRVDSAGVTDWKDSYLHRHALSQQSSGNRYETNDDRKWKTGQLLRLSAYYLVTIILRLHSNLDQ